MRIVKRNTTMYWKHFPTRSIERVGIIGIDFYNFWGANREINKLFRFYPINVLFNNIKCKILPWKYVIGILLFWNNYEVIKTKYSFQHALPLLHLCTTFTKNLVSCSIRLIFLPQSITYSCSHRYKSCIP